jgi:hypothetical protein
MFGPPRLQNLFHISRLRAKTNLRRTGRQILTHGVQVACLHTYPVNYQRWNPNNARVAQRSTKKAPRHSPTRERSETDHDVVRPIIVRISYIPRGLQVLSSPTGPELFAGPGFREDDGESREGFEDEMVDPEDRLADAS